MNQLKKLKRAKLKAKQLNLIRAFRKKELSKTKRYIKVDVPIKSETTSVETMPANNEKTDQLPSEPPKTEQKIVTNPAYTYLKSHFKPYLNLRNKKLLKYIKLTSKIGV